MQRIDNFIQGPYYTGQEQRFKMDTIKYLQNVDIDNAFDPPVCFCIESPETAAGFPDVIQLDRRSYKLIEFKVSDKYGNACFTKARLLFYRKYPHLNTDIIVWDSRAQQAYLIKPKEVKSLKVKLPAIEE